MQRVNCLKLFKGTRLLAPPSLARFSTASYRMQSPRNGGNSVGQIQQRQQPRAAVQELAPDFEAQAIVDKQIKNVNLDDYKGKWVVLFFYPLDFTFVCPTEIIAFSDRLADFQKLNAQPVAVSVDSVYSHLAWINTPRNKGGLGDMQIPIVSDIKKTISKSYNVLLPKAGVALRGLFLIDPSKKVRQITVNDLPVGRNVDEVLRLLEAFQFVDKHGEVCPANWKKGGSTMKADPEKSLDYFKNVK